MSIDIETGIEVTADLTAVESENNTEITVADSYQVDVNDPTGEVIVIKSEYSIVGDGLYASISDDEAPLWLTSIIDTVVDASVDLKFLGYSDYAQNMLDAVQALDIAENTYVVEVTLNQSLDNAGYGLLASAVFTSLNVTIGENAADIVTIQDVAVGDALALANHITLVNAKIDNDIAASALSLTTTFANADAAFAIDLDALEASYVTLNGEASGNATAISGIQTYVGIDNTTNTPNGYGMLGRVNNLESQADGLVEIYSGDYDVMLNVDQPNDPDDDLLVTNVEPYNTWTPMSGTGVPSYSGELAGRVYHDTNGLDPDTDTYYQVVAAAWVIVTAQVYTDALEQVRLEHVGDVYIRYTTVGDSSTYIRSYKFIKVAPDITPPLSTDVEGYTWAIVTDTDATAAYVKALEAIDKADGDLSFFYAWGGLSDPDATGSYTPSWDPIAIDASKFKYWYDAGTLKNKPASTWTAVPLVFGSGKYISAGDSLTVFLPDTGDTSTYIRNTANTGWDPTGPAEIVSKSKFFVELNNSVDTLTGTGNGSLTQLEIDSYAYADSVGSTFLYTNKLNLDSVWYEAGFGLHTQGNTLGGDGIGAGTAFTSEFWVHADTFKVVPTGGSPNSSDDPIFIIDGGVVKIGLDRSLATKNNFRGAYVGGTVYELNDLVTEEGILYISQSDANTGNLPSATPASWLPQTEGSLSISTTVVYSSTPNTAALSAEFVILTGRSPVKGDTLVHSVKNPTIPAQDGSYTAYYTGVALGWSQNNVLVVHGSAVIDDTLSLNSLVASGSVSSANFVAGQLGSGWAIDSDGSAEFNELNIRSPQIVGGLTRAEVFRWPAMHTSMALPIDTALPFAVIAKGTSTAHRFGPDQTIPNYGSLQTTTHDITNNYEEDSTVSLVGVFKFTSANQNPTVDGTGSAKALNLKLYVTKTNPAQARTIVAVGSGSMTYADQLVVNGMFDLDAGQTATIEMYVGSFYNGGKDVYFTGGILNTSLSTELTLVAFSEIDLDPDDITNPVITRFWFSATEFGTFSATEARWMRRDTSDDLGEIWDIGTIIIDTQGEQGAAGVEVIQTSPVITVPATFNGVVTDFSLSDNTLSVVQGDTALDYDDGPLPLGTEGTWQVATMVTSACDYAVADATKVDAVGFNSDPGTVAAFGPLTVISADSANVQYTLSVWPIGALAPINKVVNQKISKAKEGAQAYAHIAYSEWPNGIDPNGGGAGIPADDYSTTDGTDRAYQGWYAGTEANEANLTAASYTVWKRYKDAIHVAYANNNTGTNSFHISDPTGRDYVGVYVGPLFNEADPLLLPGDYTWSLMKGNDGVTVSSSYATTGTIIRDSSENYTVGSLDFSVTFALGATVLASNTYTITRSVDTWSTTVGSTQTGVNPIDITGEVITVDGQTAMFQADYIIGVYNSRVSVPFNINFNGSIGPKSRTVSAFRTTTTTAIPAHPTGSLTYTWLTDTVAAMDNSWQNPGTKPSVSLVNKYLWEVTIALVDDETAATSAVLEADWGTPSIVSAYGDTGVAGQATRNVTIFRYQSAVIVSAAGTFTDPLDGNVGWGYAVPALVNDTDEIYAASRVFTDDGLGLHEANWSTPAVYSLRTDGSAGQRIRQVNLYKLNDATLLDSTQGTFADPTSGLEAGWDYQVPSLVSDNDKAYVITRTFTDDALAPQVANWLGPDVYAQRTDGTNGVEGSSIDIVYRRLATTPGTPAASTSPPTLWSTLIPASTSLPLWASTGTRAGGVVNYTWATPVQLEGLVFAEVTAYKRASAAGLDPTTATYNFSTKVLSGLNNSWTTGVPVEDGEPLWEIRTTATASSSEVTSVPIADTAWSVAVRTQEPTQGAYKSSAFRIAATIPDTPTNGTFNGTTDTPPSLPDAWTSGPEYAGADIEWVSYRTYTYAGGAWVGSTWSPPANFTEKGGDGVSSSITAVANVLDSASDGTGYSFAGTGGTFEVREAGVLIPPADVTFSVIGSPSNGLTCTIVQSTGAYSLSGSSPTWTGDSATFTLRGVYDGNTFNQDYTVVKAKAAPEKYTWIKYADTPTTGMSDLATGKAYLGIKYNQTSATESLVYGDYEWSLVLGADGGTGATGDSTKVLYATNASGSNNFTTWAAGRDYLGVYVGTAASPSYTLYEWSLFLGDQGIQGVIGPDGPSGNPALTTEFTKPAVTLVATFAGVVTDFTGTDTTVRLKAGDNYLAWDTTPDGAGSGDWEITSIANTGCVGPTSISKTAGETTAAVIGDITSISADNASRAINISYFINGESLKSYTLYQTFSKSKSGDVGNPAVTMEFPKPAVTLISTFTGTVTDFTGTDTSVRLKAGDVYLAWDTTPDGSGDGDWEITSISNSSCSGPTSISKTAGQTTAATIGDITAISADSASRTINIAYRLPGESTKTTSVIQYFSKSKSGDAGGRGAGHFYGTVGTDAWNSTTASAACPDGTPVDEDRCTLTRSATNWVETRSWNGSSWVALVGEVIDGNLIVTGSLVATSIGAGTLAAGVINSGVLNADNITSGEITLKNAAGPASIHSDGMNNSTLIAGGGFFLGDDGGTSYDFAIGNTSKSLRWDGSLGTLVITGDLQITQGNLEVLYGAGNNPGANATQNKTDTELQDLTDVGVTGTLPAGSGGTGLISTSTLTNANVSIAANGALSGAGGGQVTLGGVGFTGDTNATANSSDAVLLDAANATGQLPAARGGTGGTVGADLTATEMGNGVTVSAAAGGIILNSGGAIRSTNMSTPVPVAAGGFFLGYNTSKYQFTVGDTGNYIRWDGAAFTIVGELITNGNIVDIKTLGEDTGTNIAIGNLAGNSLGSTAINNVAIGKQALEDNVSADYNVAIGNLAVSGLTVGNNNVGIGYQALRDIGISSNSASNVGIGPYAGLKITSGDSNIAIGLLSMGSGAASITGSHNIGLGHLALNLIQGTASFNTALGKQSGARVTTGDANVFVGYLSGGVSGTNTADGNVGIGNSVMGKVTTGGDNVALGTRALEDLTTGIYNVAVGHESGLQMTTANHCVAIGFEALDAITVAAGPFGINANIGIGVGAGSGITSGFGNVLMGAAAGDAITTGEYNTAVGTNAGGAMNGATDGNSCFGTNAGLAITTGENNTCVANNADVSALLDNQTAIGNGAVTTLANSVMVGNTAVAWIGGQVGWTTVSDERDKTDIVNLELGLDFIKDLRPVTYARNPRELYYTETSDTHSANPDAKGNPQPRRKARADRTYDYDTLGHSNGELKSSDRDIGLLAQEVQAAIPSGLSLSCVNVGVNAHGEELLSMKYEGLIPVLINAVKDQQAIIDAQQATIDNIMSRLTALEGT